MKILNNEKMYIAQLEACGLDAYLVGGTVRQRLMRELYADSTIEESSDIDIATSGTPQEVKAAFASDSWSVIDTGIAHGTVTVVHRESGEAAEITTYRIDGEYIDGRHPEQVEFTGSIDEDLRRRDFTVNAVACDGRGVIYDPVGGADDIKRKLIRTVGSPEERFREDGLRVLRGLRFAATLGFEIEQETGAAMSSCRGMLEGVSKERLYSEFIRLIVGEKADEIIRQYVDVIGVFIPEILAMKGFRQHNPYHRYDVLEHCIRAMKQVRTTEENRVYMKLAALFHDIGKPDTHFMDDEGIGHFYGHPAVGSSKTRTMLHRLKAPNSICDRVYIIVKYHDLHFENDRRLLKKWMNRYGEDVLGEIVDVKEADNFATGNMPPDLEKKFIAIRETMREIIRENQCFSLKSLAIDGDDIKELGAPQGKIIGDILNTLLQDVIEERLENKREPLLTRAEALITEQS